MIIDLKIVLIGNINAGKSSLINAILEKEVVNTSARGGETLKEDFYKIGTYNFNNSKLSLEIVDTPGLSEVCGEDHANIAIQSAKKGDLILFVVNNDLVEIEKESLEHLNDLGKPIILVFNQIDKYTDSQRKEIKDSLINNVAPIIDKENIILVSASPLKKIIVRKDNGDEELIDRKGVPDVQELKERIALISSRIGKHIDKITGYADELEKVNKEIDKLNSIKEKAHDTSFNHAVIIGTFTAVNPIPLLDLAGGATGIGAMVRKIANLYNIKITVKEAEKLTKDILFEMMTVSAGTLAFLGIGSLIKMIPFVGWLVGGTTQAASVAFAVLILGDLVSDYYANGQNWGRNSSLKESLEEKLKSVDRDRIIQRLKEKITEKVKTNSLATG
jgi:small GTP-binding protein